MPLSDRARRLYDRLVPLALIITFAVIVLGAWVRLTHAGLGCPDWPGCYGRILVPGDAASVAAAESAYPERPLEAGKAWREMIHRYAASTLGFLILAIAFAAWRNRDDADQPLAIPLVLVGVVIAQGLLGMLTVTWLLKPVIVMAHLLGGLTTLALLAWLWFSRGATPRKDPAAAPTRSLATIGLIAVVVQIALGGWTSSNYAALACPDFPTCQAQWWPEADFAEGFVLWRGLGVDYEGGVLEHPARTAIHFTHRLGALTVLALFAVLLARTSRHPDTDVRSASRWVMLALALQIALGITIVLRALPLTLATAHNAVAALLLMAVILLNHRLRHVRH